MARKSQFEEYRDINLPSKGGLRFIATLAEGLSFVGFGFLLSGAAISMLVWVFSTAYHPMAMTLFESLGAPVMTLFGIAALCFILMGLLRLSNSKQRYEVFYRHVYRGIVQDKEVIRGKDGSHHYRVTLKGFTLDNHFTEADMVVSDMVWYAAKVNRRLQIPLPQSVLDQFAVSDD